MMTTLLTIMLCTISATLIGVGCVGIVVFARTFTQEDSNRLECVVAIIVSVIMTVAGIWMVA